MGAVKIDDKVDGDEPQFCGFSLYPVEGQALGESMKSVRVVAMTAAMVAALLSATAVPVLAGNCSSQGCGVVKNNSRFPLLIADWCTGVCGEVKVVMPGEVSTKYKVDTDFFALQCYGVYVLEYDGINRSANAGHWERIYDGQVADVRYQAC